MTAHLSLAITAAGAVACAAHAGTIVISGVGNGVTLKAGDLSGTVFGGGGSQWGTDSLQSVHTAMKNSGIDTKGKITILAAQTDAGLALLTLVDRATGDLNAAPNAAVFLDTTATGKDIGHVAAHGDAFRLIDGAGDTSFATGDFMWNSAGGGDAWAWSNLSDGDLLSYRFDDVGATPLDATPFQFVTWNSALGKWELVGGLSAFDLAFSATEQFTFDAQVVPLPSAVLLGAAPILGLFAMRRRPRL